MDLVGTALVEIDVAGGWSDGFPLSFLKGLVEFFLEELRFKFFLLCATSEECIAPRSLFLEDFRGVIEVGCLRMRRRRFVSYDPAQGEINFQARATAGANDFELGIASVAHERNGSLCHRPRA